uniref:Putative secreted protein n=1 Tax=Ixodes ricinus TaxID=34613 RepID=A0A6B0USK8_IXORI
MLGRRRLAGSVFVAVQLHGEALEAGVAQAALVPVRGRCLGVRSRVQGVHGLGLGQVGLRGGLPSRLGGRLLGGLLALRRGRGGGCPGEGRGAGRRLKVHLAPQAQVPHLALGTQHLVSVAVQVVPELLRTCPEEAPD